MSAFLHPGKSINSGSLGVESFNHPRAFRCNLSVSSSCIASPCSVKALGRTCHMSIHTSYSHGTLFHGGSLASLSFQHVGSHCSLPSYHNKSYHGYFSGLSAQGSAITTFNPLAAQRCEFCRQWLFSSVVRQCQGQLKHLRQKLPAILEGMGQLMC